MKIRFDTDKAKRYLLILTVNAVPILAFLFIGELYLRSKGFHPYSRTYPGQYQDEPGVKWVQHDQSLGWTIDPEFLPGEINAQGFRDTKDFTKLLVSSDKIRIMVLGDSFVFGACLKAEETFPNLLQAELSDNYEVFNFGVPGWSIDQMYLAYQHYKDLVDPDIVILAFIDDDIERMLESYRVWEKLNKPSFTIDNGELVPRTSASQLDLYFSEMIGKSVFLSFVMREFYLIAETKPVFNYMLIDIDRDVRNRGGRFVVIRIPTRDQFESIKLLRRRLMNFEKLLKGTEATYLEPAQELTQIPNWKVDLYVQDGHLNDSGNQLLAECILKEIFEK